MRWITNQMVILRLRATSFSSTETVCTVSRLAFFASNCNRKLRLSLSGLFHRKRHHQMKCPHWATSSSKPFSRNCDKETSCRGITPRDNSFSSSCASSCRTCVTDITEAPRERVVYEIQRMRSLTVLRFLKGIKRIRIRIPFLYH